MRDRREGRGGGNKNCQEGREEKRGILTRKKEKGKNRKILFWNIAGLERQDKEFWKFITGYNYIGLMETW